MTNPRFIAGAIAALSCLMLTACGSEPATNGETETSPPPVQNYVALGDSYAALGSVDSPITGPEVCQRSADNYPSHVSADPLVEGRDVSCAGAVSDDVVQPLVTQAEEIPAQIDAVTDDTDVISLSIGGNDIGFGAIVACFVDAIENGRVSNCAPTLEVNTRAQLAELPARLDEIYQSLADRSPDATVIATGYIPLIAPGDQCPEIATISEPDRGWIITLTDELNRVVREAAERNGATAVLPEDVEQHSGCAAPEQRWVDFFGTETNAYPMHPTPAGQTAMGEAVLTELQLL